MDHRHNKRNGKFPDFKDMDSKAALWIDSKSSPDWVRSYDWDEHFTSEGEVE